jgi:hypothetical protein
MSCAPRIGMDARPVARVGNPITDVVARRRWEHEHFTTSTTTADDRTGHYAVTKPRGVALGMLLAVATWTALITAAMLWRAW